MLMLTLSILCIIVEFKLTADDCIFWELCIGNGKYSVLQHLLIHL